jgi:uncharacterized membrane protein YkgB
MTVSQTIDTLRADLTVRSEAADKIARAGRGIAFTGLVLPLLFIGGLKFTQFEINALIPLVRSAPWLAWLYGLFGHAGTSYLFGVFEISTALLLIASRRWPAAGVIGGAMGALTFVVTLSTMLVTRIWEPTAGGFPFLNFNGAFLIKDVALLGISLSVLGDSLSRLRTREHPVSVRRWKSIA